MRALIHRVVVAVFAALLVGAIWLLWESRPPLRAVDGGGAAIFGFIAWLGGLLLAVGLLFRVVARERRETTASLPIRNLRRRDARRRNRPEGVYADRALPRMPRSAS